MHIANDDEATGQRGSRDPRLSYSPGACSLAVHILLEEIGRPYRLNLVSIAEGKTSAPAFLDLNPKGRVPVLEIDGVVLTEAPAILFHLATIHPEAALLPPDPVDRFRCLEWFNWLSSAVHAVGYGQMWRPERFTDDDGQFEDIVAKGEANLADAHRLIETRLTGRVWSVGDAYSCVDPFLLVFHLWGRSVGFSLQTDFPAWSAHAERVLARDAVRRAMEQEGLTPPAA